MVSTGMDDWLPGNITYCCHLPIKLLLSAYRHLGQFFWNQVTAVSGNACDARVAAVLALMFKHFFRFSHQSSVYHCIAYSCTRTTICHTLHNTHKTAKKIHAYYMQQKNSTAWVIWLYHWCNITIHMAMTLAVCDWCCSWSASVCWDSTINWTPCIVILGSHVYLVLPNIQGYAIQILARLCKLPWISYDDYTYIPVM